MDDHLPAAAGVGALARDLLRTALAFPRPPREDARTDEVDDRGTRAARSRCRAPSVRPLRPADREDLPRGDALAERAARGSRARALDVAPGGDLRAQARPVADRHDRLAGALRG